MAKKILVVDDDVKVLELVATYLEQAGFEAITVDNGQDILTRVAEYKPDLIILDIMLPGINGFEICQELRKHSHVPIFFLSGRTSEMDKITGLNIGADDYIEKPFSPRELVARVKAHLRRHEKNTQTLLKSVLNYPGLEIDLNLHQVRVNNQFVNLSSKEFALLALLARNPNRYFKVEEMYELIWGEKTCGDTRTVIVHISNLRKKIEPDPANPIYITSSRGYGYKFNAFIADEKNTKKNSPSATTKP